MKTHFHVFPLKYQNYEKFFEGTLLEIKFATKISQNVDILVRIHGNVFPWQPAIIGNNASFY